MSKLRLSVFAVVWVSMGWSCGPTARKGGAGRTASTAPPRTVRAPGQPIEAARPAPPDGPALDGQVLASVSLGSVKASVEAALTFYHRAGGPKMAASAVIPKLAQWAARTPQFPARCQPTPAPLRAPRLQ